jgi:hypothetical protein
LPSLPQCQLHPLIVCLHAGNHGFACPRVKRSGGS